MSSELWEEMLGDQSAKLIKLENKYAARLRRQQVGTYSSLRCQQLSFL